jgi:hypothetical protein
VETPNVSLPKLYLVDISVLRQFDKLPKFEELQKMDVIASFSFERCPEFKFVSHKWHGIAPDDDFNSLFQYLLTMSGYVWVDYMCVPQDVDFQLRLPFLKSIPYVILCSKEVVTPIRTNEYRRSVWCNMEQFLEKDEALALVDEFKILKAEDLGPIISGLHEILNFLVYHSRRYRAIVEHKGKEGDDFERGKVAVFQFPQLAWVNPTFARICEFYLRSRYLVQQ